MNSKAVAASVIAAVMVSGCVTQPTGPYVAVAPGQGKSWDAFQQDDSVCRDFAAGRVAGRADNANDHAILSAIIGAGLGAALGGAIGGGRGAGVGAAAGGVAGTAYGADRSGREQGGLQRQYDLAYAQCMAAKGNDVPPPFGYRHRPHRDDYSPRRDDRDDGPPPPPDD